MYFTDPFGTKVLKNKDVLRDPRIGRTWRISPMI